MPLQIRRFPVAVFSGVLFLSGLLPGSSATLLAAPAIPGAPSPICLTDGQVEDLQVVNGTLFLAGRFTHVRPPGALPGDPSEVARKWFAACNAATGAVLAWDPQIDCVGGTGPCTNARGQTIALAPGGTALYLGGKFDQVGGATQRHATKVALATAVRDTAFVPAPNDRVQRIVVAPDGARVYIGGNFTGVGGCAPTPCHSFLAAVDPASGAAVAAFNPSITTADSSFRTVYSMVFNGDADVLYIGGQFDTVNGASRTSLAAIDPATGTQTLAFGPRLSDTNPEDGYVQIFDLQIDDDWVYVCGDWWATGDVGDMHNQRNVNRFHPITGDVDSDFWIGTDGGVQACRIDPGSGVLFAGGHFDCVRAWTNSTTPVDPAPAQCGTDPDFHGTFQRDQFALRLRDGALLPWNPDTGGIGGTWAMAVVPGTLFTGGELTWPRTGTATHTDVLKFILPLFADDFESSDLARWSAAFL
ncbi:MAG: hypothetical protein ABI639_14425 [Thermoanaerobaculia bacterium]